MSSDETPESDKVESKEELRSGEQPSNSKTIWIRLLFMLLFIFLYGVTRVVVAAVVVVQAFWALIASKPNAALAKFGSSLASYTYQLVSFLTFANDERPFPVDSEWPNEPVFPTKPERHAQS